MLSVGVGYQVIVNASPPNAIVDWLDRLGPAHLDAVMVRVGDVLTEAMELRRIPGRAPIPAEDLVAGTLFSEMALSTGLRVTELAALMPRARQDARDAVLWLLTTELLSVMSGTQKKPVVRSSRGRPVRARN